MSPVASRVVAALGAGAFGQAVNILIQLASLPLFLYKWDPATYGVWLVLSAIPAYLTMADLGMVATSGNRMTMALAQGDGAQATRIFQSTLRFMVLVCGSALLLAVAFIAWAPIETLQGLDHRLALMALVSTVILAMFSGLCDAIFRATGRYAQGLMLGNLTRLFEWAGSMVGLFLVGSFTAVAVGALLARLAGLIVMVGLSRRSSQGVSWGMAQGDWHEVRAMAKPALSFMAFPLANALSFQGVTLLVAKLFGPTEVALFNTYRTIARVAVQVTGIFSHSLWAEFSRSFGHGGAAGAGQLYRRSNLIGIASSLLLCGALYLASPLLLKVWTHGAIEFKPELMMILLVYACVGSLWHVPRVFLLSTNQHIGIAQWSLATAVLCVVLAYALGQVFGMNGVAGAMLVSEACIAVACLMAVRVVLLPKNQTMVSGDPA